MNPLQEPTNEEFLDGELSEELLDGELSEEELNIISAGLLDLTSPANSVPTRETYLNIVDNLREMCNQKKLNRGSSRQ